MSAEPLVRKWWLKCAAQAALAVVPGGDRINHSFRRGRLRKTLDAWTIDQALLHVRILRDAGVLMEGATSMEIGVGWKPLFPLIYKLAGFGKMILIDANRHLETEWFLATISQLRTEAERVANGLGIDADAVRSGLDPQGASTLDELLKRFEFDYRAPADARKTRLPNGSIDVVSSRAVLEHVRRADIAAILLEARRVLSAGGAMIHTIDHSDHFEFADKSISRINFLRFSERWWRLIGMNHLSYQNRLRSSAYTSMAREAGFDITFLDAQPDPVAMKDIASLPLAPPFCGMRKEDLAVLTTHMVARPA
jgi:SAM-dependent methyltransferase